MTDAVVERVTALVSLDRNSEAELAQARHRAASGDESWEEWIDEHAAGTAVIAELELEITLVAAGAIERERFLSAGVWLELHPHPPLVECQVQEAAAVVLSGLAQTLAERVRLPSLERRLTSMCVHVELDDEVRELLPSPDGPA